LANGVPYRVGPPPVPAEDFSILRRLKAALLVLAAILVIGTVGYMLIEGFVFIDAFYMTVITVATVGFEEVHQLSQAGELFTILIILLGVGALGYTVGVVAEFMVEGHLLGLVEVRRLETRLSELKDHYILCGYGRVGEEVARSFSDARVPFVVIEMKDERVAECVGEGNLCFKGDATQDEVLTRAGIERARGLVCAVDTDADNVFVVLSARTLNPQIMIVARSNEVESEAKLAKAGADRVLSPAAIDGRRMANLLVKPVISDYLDFVTHGNNLEFHLEEVTVSPDSELASKTIGEAHLRAKAGVLILAVRKPDGRFDTNPSSSTLLETGDSLVAIGTDEQVEAFKRMV